MASRYSNRIILRNNNALYQKFIKERNLNFMRQYNTAIFRYPNAAQITSLNRVPHVWSSGDRLYKLAGKYYSSPTYWWVIAWFNKTPTEAHLRLGDVVNIPLPLESILELFEA
jgi:hypothetical protein